MKIGVYSNAFREYSLEEALGKIQEAGIEMVELGCGEESGFAHCNPEELLEVQRVGFGRKHVFGATA